MPLSKLFHASNERIRDGEGCVNAEEWPCLATGPYGFREPNIFLHPLSSLLSRVAFGCFKRGVATDPNFLNRPSNMV